MINVEKSESLSDGEDDDVVRVGTDEEGPVAEVDVLSRQSDEKKEEEDGDKESGGDTEAVDAIDDQAERERLAKEAAAAAEAEKARLK